MRAAYAAMLDDRKPCEVCDDLFHHYEQHRHPNAGELMCLSCMRCNGGYPDPYAGEMPRSACVLYIGAVR